MNGREIIRGSHRPWLFSFLFRIICGGQPIVLNILFSFSTMLEV